MRKILEQGPAVMLGPRSGAVYRLPKQARDMHCGFLCCLNDERIRLRPSVRKEGDPSATLKALEEQEACDTGERHE